MTQYQKMENIRPWEKRPKQYMKCTKHNMVFLEGWECPDCEKHKFRDIFAPWEPTCDTQPEQELLRDQSVTLSVVAAASEQAIPPTGVYRLAICPLHKMEYIQGLNECPECRCWAS